MGGAERLALSPANRGSGAGHPLGSVVHLTHSQAQPVPQKGEPLAAGPGDQFFDALRLVFGVREWFMAVPFRRPVGPVNGTPGPGV
jgi:hypothetical protein